MIKPVLFISNAYVNIANRSLNISSFWEIYNVSFFQSTLPKTFHEWLILTFYMINLSVIVIFCQTDMRCFFSLWSSPYQIPDSHFVWKVNIFNICKVIIINRQHVVLPIHVCKPLLNLLIWGYWLLLIFQFAF